MTDDGDVGSEFRDEMNASPQEWGLRAGLWHAREDKDWIGRGTIEKGDCRGTT